MAETKETVNIEVLIQATKSAKTLGQLEKSIDDVTDALGNIEDEGSDAFKKLSKAVENSSEDMVRLALDTDQTTATIGELERGVEVLTEKLKGVDRGSEEFEKLSTKLIDTSRELKNVELSLEALDSEQVASELGSVAGAVGDVTTSFILLSGTGNETLEEIAKNVETAIGVAVGFKGAIEGIQSGLKLYRNFSNQIKNSTALLKLQAVATKGLAIAQKLFSKVVGTSAVAMKGFRAVLISTGIGALVVGIGLLVANFEKLKGLLSSTSAEQKLLNDVQAKGIGIASEELNAIDKLTNVINAEGISREERNEAIRELQKTYPDLLSNINLETASTKDVNAEIEKYNELVILRAQAEASAEIRAEKYKEILEAQTEAQTGQNIGILDSAQGFLQNVTYLDLLTGGLTRTTDLTKASADAQKIANEGTAEANALIQNQIDVLDNLDAENKKKQKALEIQLGLDKKAVENAKKLADDKKKQEEQDEKDREARAKQREANRIQAIKDEQQRLKDLAILEEEILQQGLATAEELEARKLLLQLEAQRERINKLVKDDERLKTILKITEEKYQKDLKAIRDKYDDLDEAEKQKLINNATKTATEILIIEEKLNLARLDKTEENAEARAKIESNILDLRVRQIEENGAILLQNDELTADERVKIEKATQLEIANIRAGARDIELQAQKDALDKSAENIKANEEQLKGALLELALGTAQQISDALFEQTLADNERRSEAVLESINAQYEEESEALNRKVEDGIISQKQADRELLRLEKDQAKAQLKEQKKAFEENKKIQKSQAIINGALAFTSALATTQPLVPLGLIAGAGVLISTGIQIAKIQSTKFAKGGILKGPSHAQGGITTPFGEVEGGEAVINKRSTKQFRKQLSQINQAGGGVSFASGGILGDDLPASGSGDISGLSGVLEKLSENLSKPSRSYVVESDITESQDQVLNLENNADI